MKLNSLKSLFILALFSVSLLVGGVVFYYKLDPAFLTKLSFYIDLANPSVKLVRVQQGWRKEQIAEVVGKRLGWTDEQKDTFVNAHLALNTENLEGKYFPDTYFFKTNEDPISTSELMLKEFSNQVGKIKKQKPKEIINEDTAIKIASLIERESGGKEDMALISGIIWNRIFNGMRLQIDATLQYAKGSEEDGWWRSVKPEDKKIDSKYNTYLYKGLPPSPISNPGIDAIYAAYNPEKTECIYYLHDKEGKIHCTKTYEEHKKNIELYY